MHKKWLFFLTGILMLMLPMVQYAQYDEAGNLITLNADQAGGQSPLVYKLPNGLTVILYADRTQPQVTGMVVTLAGGKNDLPDATGMAHYMEHMLFKGTTKIGTTDWDAESGHISRIFELYDSLALTKDKKERQVIQKKINEESLLANEYVIPNELDRILKEMGSTGINAGTGPDYTVFYNIFPPHEMERWLEVYSHRFISPVFRSFQAELEVVYEEKNMYSDMFFMNVFEEFNKHFYKVHPYGQQPLIGTIEHLKNPSLTKMKEFYDRWYVANNMALILAGDFDIMEVLPMITDKFSNLPSGKLPEKTTWVETPFNGRELVEKKLSPIKIGLLGFRIPENGHPDKRILEVVSQILSNNNTTGLIDKLFIDNKLLQAACQNVHYNDYGTGLIIFVPKVAGQSLDAAEKLVTDELKRLRNGEFSDTLLEAIKLNLYKEKILNLESTTSVAYALMEAFTTGKDFGEIFSEPYRIREISRDDVIRVANEYYGDNYLAFHSKTGFPKKAKIDKPGYEPVTLKQDLTSQYYKMITGMAQKKPHYSFVDFEQEIQKLESDMGYSFYRVENNKNDIFTLTIRYGIGEGRMPILKYVSEMMNLSGTEEMTVDQFRLEMAMLGCTYNISCNDSYLTISLNGPEESFMQGIKLLGILVHHPKLDDKKLAILATNEKASRKMERSEPDIIADALMEYVLYGNQSDYLNRLTMKEIQELKADTILASFARAILYAPEIHFVGRLSVDEVRSMLEENYRFPENPIPTTAPFYRVPTVFMDNGVFVTNKKKALQSKIFFHATLEEFTPQNLALHTAFNTYFGGDFSGLVMQEIREYRSMAYTAGAALVQPPVKGHRMTFQGYVGTQADKTNEAVDVFVGLVRNMPQKPDRIEMIKRYITAAAVTQRPDFRRLSTAYVGWKQKGFEKDPARLLIRHVNEIGVNTLFDYQKIHLVNTPLTIIMAGNMKKFSTKELEKYGKLTLVKEKELFSK